jgi:sugar/nucleoside kinase (ribokinase family)
VIGGVQVDVVLTPVSELPPSGQTRMVDQMSFRAGGAGANAALAFAEAGVPTRLLGCVGNDHLGRFLAEELAPFGLDSQLTVLGAAPTGLTVACEGPGRDRTFMTYLGVNSNWSASMIPAEALDADSLLLCDYFCLPVLRGDPARELLIAARAAGVSTFFDTAWDAGGWQPDTRREVIELLAEVDVFLPNEAELIALTGTDDIEQAAAELQAVSGGWIVVKLGARGALAVGPEGARGAAAARPLAVVDSTGAGDAFNAGLIAALGEGQDVPAALQAATALAGRIIARPAHARHASLSP